MPAPFSEASRAECHPALIRLWPEDDVAIARRPIRPGEELWVEDGVRFRSDRVPPGHKIALRSIVENEPILKYGQIIGFAKHSIAQGSHIHTHNLESREFRREVRVETSQPVQKYPEAEHRLFRGFARDNGRVGTRNYIAVISNVNCSASVAKYVRDHFSTKELQRDFPNVDGILAFTHKHGCVIQPGEPTQLLNRVLAGVAKHPNIAGYLMIGLGCEGNQLSTLRSDFSLGQSPQGANSPFFLSIQSQGGIRKTVEAGVRSVTTLLPRAQAAVRSPFSLSNLILAENCGGSDAHSGVTANPALGWASDELIRHGASSVLAETPEIYGAEHLLAARAQSPEVARQLLDRVRWWEEHVKAHGCSIDNNPSFGNKEGGLTTIYEKSLGAVAKGGQSPLMAVYRYAEQIVSPGLCFMDTPGFDPVSMTGLMAGGCNVGVFTTGRGSVYGCKPMPCIKVSTTTSLYDWMIDDIDLNAGTILDGTETVAEVGMRLLEKIISVASGERTKSEGAGVGDEEFAPWILGPTL